MTSRWRKGLAASREAEESWAIKFAVRGEDGALKRYRIHVGARLHFSEKRPSRAEFQAYQDKARDTARAKAKELTEQADVVWVSVFPPFLGRVNAWRANTTGYWDRVAPVSRWTRSKGWTTSQEG